MKLSEDDKDDIRQIRNNLITAVIFGTCSSVIAGIVYLVTVLPPSIKALQEDVAPLAPRITAMERELNNHRIDIERFKVLLKAPR